MAQPAPSRWTCPTCHAVVATAFCPGCGERPLLARDLTLRGLFDRLFQAMTSLDGRVLRTAWTLLRRPGAVTVAYVAGKRKPYIAPFQLFLLANLLFFAVQSFSEANVFGANLDSHLHLQDWQAEARSIVGARLEGSGLTYAMYEPTFDRVVAANAKSLVILMTVPFALLLAMLFHAASRPFIVHAVFSLHAWTVILIIFSLALVIADIDVLAGGAGLKSAHLDTVLSIVNGIACALYVFLATGTVYGAQGARRLLKSLALTLALGVIVLGYRFLMFLVTVYFTT